MPCEPCPAIDKVPLGIEVFRSEPCRCLGGMSAFRPSPQLDVDMVVRQVERMLRRAIPIIVRPAPDQRAEVADYLAGRGLTMLAQIVSNAAQVPHQFGLLRLRQDHATIAPHGEAEEVEAFIDMNNPGLR